MSNIAPWYVYAVQNGEREELGGIELADDEAALNFGRQVVRDAMGTEPGRYAGSTMDITENERSVGSIAFEAE